MWLTCTCKKLIMLLKSKIIGKGSDILIVLHGFLGMSDNWNSFAKKIYNQGFQIHLLDQRNHGDSFHSKEFNYELLSNDLKYGGHFQRNHLSRFQIIDVQIRSIFVLYICFGKTYIQILSLDFGKCIYKL